MGFRKLYYIVGIVHAIYYIVYASEVPDHTSHIHLYLTQPLTSRVFCITSGTGCTEMSKTPAYLRGSTIWKG